MQVKEHELSPASSAFSRQAESYDAHDDANPILQHWRRSVYAHVSQYLKPGSRILELNAGTGIDALHFVREGHSVLATDAAVEMINQIQRKVVLHDLRSLTAKQLKAEDLGNMSESEFDYVFSNFGGLNCISDLSLVAQGLHFKMRPGTYLTWVIMPPLCPWEWLRLLKGNWSEATRRLHHHGATSHIEGVYFKTYYHSVRALRRALGSAFKLIQAEGLGIFSAPPASKSFYTAHKSVQSFLEGVDHAIKDIYPFNRIGDHVIVTFQKIK